MQRKWKYFFLSYLKNGSGDDNVSWSAHHFGPDWNILTTLELLWNFIDIQGSQRMNFIWWNPDLSSRTKIKLTFVVQMRWVPMKFYIIFNRYSRYLEDKSNDFGDLSFNFSSSATKRLTFKLFFFIEIAQQLLDRL